MSDVYAPFSQPTLQQSALWDSAVQRAGFECVNGQPRLVMRARIPVLGDIALISRAALDLDVSAARDLRDAMGVRHLAINAETAADAGALAGAGFYLMDRPRQIAELPLDPSTATMAARLDGNWRNRLRHGQARGLMLRRRPMPPDARHWLFRCDRAQARRLGYRPFPPPVIAAMLAMHPGAGQIFTAYHKGQKVAAMLFPAPRHGGHLSGRLGGRMRDGACRRARP